MRVYHALFNYGLSANAIKTYIYLTYCQNCLGTAVVKGRTIAEACGISSLATVAVATNELQQKGLVVKYNRYNSDGHYVSNGYHVTQLRGKYLELDMKNRPLLLPKASFATYLFLLKCASKHKRRAFLSCPHFLYQTQC